ncbi:Uncharacterised protein [Bordetella pertussis]|nr:Uncharacterised protein [Bordetella pertussis]CFP60508.1 Uncharacterised protein [Bordetella pertussis]
MINRDLRNSRGPPGGGGLVDCEDVFIGADSRAEHHRPASGGIGFRNQTCTALRQRNAGRIGPIPRRGGGRTQGLRCSVKNFSMAA